MINTERRHYQDQIAARVYQLWEQNGCPQGRAWDDWLQVEAELKGLNGTKALVRWQSEAIFGGMDKMKSKEKGSL